MSDCEAQFDTGEEDIEHARKADVATPSSPAWDAMDSSTYCQNKHALCSICFGEKKKCTITGCAKKAFLTLDFLSELVKDLKLPVPCKFKQDGCRQENAHEEVIDDHEIECGHSEVTCFMGGCPDQPTMDFEGHLFSTHDLGKFRDKPGMWFFQKFLVLGAKKMGIDSESGSLV